LEQVHDFKFLGSYKSADRDCTKESIALADKRLLYWPVGLWKDRNIKKLQRKSK